MLASKRKISLGQAMLIFLVAAYSPTMRFVIAGGAKEAKQAAWLAPFIALAITIPIIFIFHSIYKKYTSSSFTEIMEDIFGIAIGKIITVFYIIFLTVLTGTSIYNDADKLTSTVYPNVSIQIFIIILLATVALLLRKGGIIVLARMNEIIFLFIASVFIIMLFFALKDIRINRLTPISYLDIFPIFKANLPVLGSWSIFSLVFLFSDYINDKEKIARTCSITALTTALLTVFAMVICIGILGAATTEISPVPYVTTIKQVSAFEGFERLEAAHVGLWIMADFTLSSVQLFCVLNMLKSLFKLSDTKPLTLIYSAIIYFVIQFLGKNIFEQNVFGLSVIMPLNIFFGFVLPILIFVVAKVRKKI